MPAKRPSRQSGPAGGAKKRDASASKSPSRGRAAAKSRSKSASPTRKRQASKSRAATPATKPPKQAASRSRSSSRSRAAAKSSSDSPAKQAKPKKAATPKATPKAKAAATPSGGATAARRSRPATPSRAAAAASAAAAYNHSPSSSPSRVAAAIAAAQQAKLSSSPTRAGAAAAAAGTRREFGGPLGAAVITCCLPVALVWLSLLSDGVATFGRANRWLFALPRGLHVADLFSLRAALIYGGWLVAQLVLYCLPIGGKWVQQDGGWYHCNGLFALIVSMAGMHAAYLWGYPVGSVLCAELTRLTVCACLFSLLLSMGLLLRSRRVPTRALTAAAAAAAPAGRCGLCSSCCATVYGFFMGRELNPRLFKGRLDLKFFLEMRPGLIGWVLLDMAFLYQARETRAAAAGVGVGSPFAHLVFMHAWYVCDALLFERSILTTTDIKREGLGFMLAFGNLAWVPFFYSLSARQMIKQPAHMPFYCLLGVALVNIFGYWLFRFSNRQKDLYRREPHSPCFVGCRTVPTGVRSHQLLADGFWGRLRHPNFTGDLIMATAWSLSAGCHSPLAWLYPAYLLVLLVHRARRDEIHCADKYGVAWQRYCQLVPWRLVPRIY